METIIVERLFEITSVSKISFKKEKVKDMIWKRKIKEGNQAIEDIS